MDRDVVAFYDGLAPDYHLAYGGNWDAAVERQGAALDRLIRAALPDAQDVLDCSCGIGTQAIGLALRGYRVAGTDPSAGALSRAGAEAERLGAALSFAVADFRDLTAIPGAFDVVISCDNALPHLLDPDDVVAALREMHAKLHPGGLLLVTLRDFDEALRTRPPVAPAISVPGPPRQVLVRLHDWDADAPLYTVRYLILTQHADGWTVAERTTRYRAITREELSRAASSAGFDELTWHDEDDVVVGGQLVVTARR
jgi:glycine/sarcosine N-methyltransferase